MSNDLLIIRKVKNQHYPSGFTLIELMMTLTIFIIISQLAVPTFQKTIINNQLSSLSDSIERDFNYARNHAITRKIKIFIRPSNNSWIIKEDSNRSNIHDSTDTILRMYQPKNEQLILSTSDNNHIENQYTINETGIWEKPVTFNITHHQCRNVLSELSISGLSKITKKNYKCLLR